ncbi:MAG: hypothetical protein RLZZ297_1593 [Chloroflexota bacterium]
MSAVYSTPRLHWRPLVAADHAVVYRQFSDADMCTFFSEPACSWADAGDIITHYAGDRSERSSARWGLFDLQSGAFIGTCGYHFYDRTAGNVELGYDVWKDYWRRGYGSEALGGLLALCAERLVVSLVYTMIHPDNTASIRLAQRHGFSESPLLRPIDTTPTVCLARAL